MGALYIYAAFITTIALPSRIPIPRAINWVQREIHMRNLVLNLAFAFASAYAKASTAVTNACWTLMGGQTGNYRPEAHYMRGPGPKWRAKNMRSEM